MSEIQKRYEIISNPKEIPEMCLELKMNCDGSSDNLSNHEMNQYAQYLGVCLKTWQQSSEGVLRQAFDNTIRNLVIATLEIYASYHGNNQPYNTLYENKYNKYKRPYVKIEAITKE